MDSCNSCEFGYYLGIVTFYEDDKKSIKFLRDHGVLPKCVKCPFCNKKCVYNESLNIWRCRNIFLLPKSKKRRFCNFSISDFKGTLLETRSTSLPPWKIIQFCNHYLSQQWDHKTIKDCLGMTPCTILELQSLCSEVMQEWITKQEPIGGYGVEIEVNKIVVPLNQGLSQIKLLSGVERISQQNFVVVLNKEEHQENCLPLIQRYVKPGSVIYSEILDESGYLSSLGYVHITVNYSENNATELGSIKKLQRAIKIHIKRVESTGKDMNRHIARFKFISSIKNKKELLHQFFTEVGKCYPPFSNKRNRNFYQGNTDSDKQLTICKETNSDEEFIEFSQRDDDEELAGTDSD